MVFYNDFIYYLSSKSKNEVNFYLPSCIDFIISNFDRLLNENIYLDINYNAFNYSDNFYYQFFLAYITKNESDRVNFLMKININGIYNIDNYLYKAIIRFENEENKLEFVDLIKDQRLKSKIYLSLKKKNLIKENIKNLTHEDCLAFLLSLSDKEKIEYIRKDQFVSILICSLSIENFYTEFGLISDVSKLECIDKIESPIVKYEILKQYRHLFSEEVFLNYMSKIYMDTLDRKLKEDIIQLINNVSFERIIYSNIKNKKQVLKGIDPFMYDIKLSRNYSIGLELETSHKDYLMYLNLKNILSDWTLKEETTVNNGVEINSSIMHYKKKSLSELVYICDFLNKCGFEVNDECSNHVHIGFDVFKSVNEIKILLELFANNENIFYNLANETGNGLRKFGMNYSGPISVYLENAIYLHKFSKTNDLYDFIKEVQLFQEDRFTSVNFLNAFSAKKNTVEFRMSNGQIKYEEILLNMILYLKLIDISINYKKIDRQLYDYICNINVPEEERKMLLINLLFKDNSLLMEKFNERYDANSEINKSLKRLPSYKRQVKFYD